jgi:hypothetical protein
MSDAIDMVNKPPHYAGARWEAIEIIEALGNQFRLGNALKYIFRHKKKGGDEDLKKARWYLEREFGQKAFSQSDSFDLRFWQANFRDFAESFGIEDMHLIGAISAISHAHYWAWDRNAIAWREAVHNALTHLNAYLVPVDLNPE